MWSEERFVSTVSRGRDLLAQGAGINDVIALAHQEGFPFIQCVRLLTGLGAGLAEAKPLVHNNQLYVESRQDREEFWEELAEAAGELTRPSQIRPTEATGVEQGSTATDDAWDSRSEVGVKVDAPADEIEYRTRRTQALSFVLGVAFTAGMGTVIAVGHSGLILLAGLSILFNFLTWLYLAGPSASLVLRANRLEVRNPLVTYVIPRRLILGIESLGTIGVRAKVDGDRRIWIRALSPATYRFRSPSSRELRQRAEDLERLLTSTAAVDFGDRIVAKRRWVNLIVIGVGAIFLIIVLLLSRQVR